MARKAKTLPRCRFDVLWVQHDRGRRVRRQDIQLLARARQGNIAARCEAGRRYLLGLEGFPKHIASGIDYLSHPDVKGLPQAAQIIAETLPLQDIIALHQQTALEAAAAAGVCAARAKLGAWLTMTGLHSGDGMRWLELAATQGHSGAAEAVAALTRNSRTARLDLLKAFSKSGDLDARTVAMQAAQHALTDPDLTHFAACMQCVLALTPSYMPDMSDLVVAALRSAQQANRSEVGMDSNRVEACLDARVARGDMEAAFMLGRALCGIACGSLLPGALVGGPNMRKGAALLLRAADAGCDEAWVHLYQVHADNRASVANPQMARFFLEKAAMRGQVDAQRRLGAITLRSASCLEESEQGIHWLYQAASRGDTAAMHLLKSLVLSLEGHDEDADAAIEAVMREDPWLAVRLRLSRDFGLTKLEALCVDPTHGLRPWGLVVGKNPFIQQVKLSAPRAVPAISPAALQNLRKAAAFFEQGRQDCRAIEGDLRRRSLRQRRAFERYRLQDSMFFADANSTTLESLRHGSKWAFRARHPLELALAA